MHLSVVPLTDAHVRLEPLLEAHREPLRPLADDLASWQVTSMRADGEHFDPWFDGILASAAAGRIQPYAVWSEAHGTWAGHTAYVSIVPEHARTEIGSTWYGPGFRGTQVNPACKRLLLAHAFDAGALRVELKTHILNTHSQRAMEKLGATREGVLRSHMATWKGPRRDSVYYAILAEEWPAVRAGLDARLGDSSVVPVVRRAV
ncbi:MAG: GNAT family N-acetyltransferase [Myxococcales bacterium]|nr:GNAT family N-acetyltransferase [Myxococcales bacterium]